MHIPLHTTASLQRGLCLLSVACCLVSVSSFSNQPRPSHRSQHVMGSPLKMSSDFGQDEQVTEAIRSLCDFHEGQWEGTATSFSISQDVAAGIIKRETSPTFKTAVKLGMDENRQFSLTETFEWGDKLSSRSLVLNECNMDVDSVDASYSLDSSLPDFPSEISGSDKLNRFAIEHCIAASDDRRTKCMAFYGLDQSLQRIVLTSETRIKEDESKKSPPTTNGEPTTGQLTARDLLEMESDIDRLVEKITGNMENKSTSPTPAPTPPSSPLEQLGKSMSSTDGAVPLSPHDISLLELSSGVFLGDAVIRDMPTVPDSPGGTGKGFGSKSIFSSEKPPFGSWEVGVQKIAWRWMWNFGEEIRQVVDIGKAMGASLSKAMTKSLGGNVCVNEGLSRRIPKDKRMVYIDWSGDMVGFLSGPVSIQVPRYLNFDKEAIKDPRKPFFTEFCLYQSTDEGPIEIAEVDEAKLPEICCSKLSRVYNYAGQLKQGVSSFYTFKRFGMEEEDT